MRKNEAIASVFTAASSACAGHRNLHADVGVKLALIYAKRGECCWYSDRYSYTEKAMEAKGHLAQV